jgi:hypothetical protein
LALSFEIPKSPTAQPSSSAGFVAFGFRFLLVLEDGSPSDPAVLNTSRADAASRGSESWRSGTMTPPSETNGALVVEAVEN